MLLFSKLNKLFFGYFYPDKIFFKIMKMNNFQGELTNISAKKETLILYCRFLFDQQNQDMAA